MIAYYNENDPKAAAWLRELIKDGLIAPGYVDERSISEVQPADLQAYAQCHFFAGIGGWSLALRLAGVEDREPVWTGSCPCPPFSSAGKKKACPECGGKRPIPCPRRTGYFICVDCEHAWFADGRHLWPEFWRLIRDCNPPITFGEQVAGADGLIWFAGVRATLERIGYSVGASDLTAASINAPHIRQRMFWMAHAMPARRPEGRAESRNGQATRGSGLSGMELSTSDGRGRSRISHGREGQASRAGKVGGLAHGDRERCEERTEQYGEPQQSEQQSSQRDDALRCSGARGVAHPEDADWWTEQPEGSTGGGRRRSSGGRRMGEPIREGLEGYTGDGNDSDKPGRIDTGENGSAAASGSAWDSFDLLPCTDGKARRVESGTFPLAHGIPGRVGLLRGYGNAIVPQLAAEFIQAGLEAITAVTSKP